MVDKGAAKGSVPLTVGGLFSGIGGWELGLERAGMEIAWHCEADPFCRRVLERHWPGVPCFDDVCTLNAGMAEGVDVLCGGFPCPVLSQAARGRNVADWMWPDYVRLIREFRPRYVLVENVEGLIHKRRIAEVLGDLAECGIDATWRVLRASDFGAPHHRARVWLVGYPYAHSKPDGPIHAEAPWLPELHGQVRGWPNPPGGLGMDDGLPDRMDRLRSLGNALVPQIAEWIGRRIVAYEMGLERR